MNWRIYVLMLALLAVLAFCASQESVATGQLENIDKAMTQTQRDLCENGGGCMLITQRALDHFKQVEEDADKCKVVWRRDFDDYVKRL